MQFFVPTLDGVSKRKIKGNHRTDTDLSVASNSLGQQQASAKAGCSAFATLEEDASPKLIATLEPVLKNLVFAFDKYQHKNMLILYDAVGTLADAVGSALQAHTYVDILMLPLLKR